MPTSTHYVVHVKVEKVTKSEQAGYGRGDDRSERTVDDVLVFTAKHDSLETVIDRVTRHLRIEAGADEP